MTKRILTSLTVLGAALAATAVAPASAAQTDGATFAEHVRTCQADMGLNGVHNPGVMHEGAAGWEAHHAH